jgi:4-amino-4-deoxy-L-arabinose transferase-like glycosyltransferase
VRPSSTALARSAPLAWAGLFAIFTLIWFVALGTRSLIHPDEGRYAALALEMARSGDWVTPRLNGVLYFEKPALQYWIGALSFQVLGVSEFSARFWPGAAGFLTALITAFTAMRLWGRDAGVRALAISASMTWIIGNSHFLTLDAGLTLFLTLTLCAHLLAQHDAADALAQRRWTLLAWAAMACAVLSKGLVGLVIPGAALLIASLWSRDFGVWARLHWRVGGALFLAIAAPWFILVSLRNPDFAQFFFIHEHFARYLTHVHQREGTWWYYVPLLLLGLLPWTSSLPWLLRRGPDDASPSALQLRRTLVAWIGFVFVFFSASGSKLPSYILPLFPALALLLTLQLRKVQPRALRWHLLLPTLVWLCAGLASTQLGGLGSADTPQEVLAVLAGAIQAGAGIFLVGAFIAWLCLGQERRSAALLCVAFAHFAAFTLVMQGHDAFGQMKSAHALAPKVLPLLDKDTPVFALRDYDQTLPFYLRRNVMLVDYVDEFEFGQQHEPGKSLATLDEFIERWHALPGGAAYMTRETWDELRRRDVSMRIVFEDPRRLVVIKP